MNNQYRFSLNISGKKKSKYCIFGVPKSNEYQTVRNVQFEPKPDHIQPLNPWGNDAAVFSLKNIEDKIALSFWTRPLDIQKKINPSWMLSDYHGVKIFTDRFINGDDKQIQQRSKDILHNEKNILIIAQKLYRHTLKYLTYGSPILGLYSYSQVLRNQTTDCGGFSTYLLSLFQSIGIPGRLVVGYMIKKSVRLNLQSFMNLRPLDFNSLLMHAWIEVKLPDSTWFPLDPSMEWRRIKGSTKRLGGFGVIPDDRLVISYGEDFKLKINKTKFTIDLLQHPIYL